MTYWGEKPLVSHRVDNDGQTTEGAGSQSWVAWRHCCEFCYSITPFYGDVYEALAS